MSDFKAKMHQILFRLGRCSRPRLGELTALPQTPRLASKGGEGKRMEGIESRLLGERSRWS